MSYEKSLEELEKTIQELIEENKKMPVIVEGEKDIEALRKLGLTGEIIRFNKGLSISDFCDEISSKYKDAIILTDWDRKGGQLCHLLAKNLEGRVHCNTKFRETFAKRSKTKTIEGLPSWIETLKGKLAYSQGFSFNYRK